MKGLKVEFAMTPKQERFVAEYLVDLNATQAAIRAGYSERVANREGSRLLSNVVIAAVIASRQKKIAQKLEVTQERIVAELARIGFADIRKVVGWRRDSAPDEVKEELEPQPHGGALKRSRASAHTIVDVIPSDEIDDDTAAAIAEISQTEKGLRVKFHDKKGALVDLGKHLGMFKDELRLVGDPDRPVVHRVVREIVDPNRPQNPNGPRIPAPARARKV